MDDLITIFHEAYEVLYMLWDMLKYIGDPFFNPGPIYDEAKAHGGPLVGLLAASFRFCLHGLFVILPLFCVFALYLTIPHHFIVAPIIIAIYWTACLFIGVGSYLNPACHKNNFEFLKDCILECMIVQKKLYIWPQQFFGFFFGGSVSEADMAAVASYRALNK